MNKKYIILIVAAVSILAAAFAFFAASINLLSTNDAVIEFEQITINALDDGKIKDILVKPEQNITSGQPVAEIDVLQPVKVPVVSNNASAEILKKKLHDAEEKHTSFAVMYKDGVISQQEYDKSLENLVSARNNYQLSSNLNSNVPPAKKNQLISVTKKIYAPMDGTVSINYLIKGDKISKNTPIMLITTDKPKIVAYFDPKYRDKINEGDYVNIKSSKFHGKVFDGVIEKIAAEPEMHVDKKSQVLPVTIRFNENISGYTFEKDTTLSVSIKK